MPDFTVLISVDRLSQEMAGDPALSPDCRGKSPPRLSTEKSNPGFPRYRGFLSLTF